MRGDDFQGSHPVRADSWAARAASALVAVVRQTDAYEVDESAAWPRSEKVHVGRTQNAEMLDFIAREIPEEQTQGSLRVRGHHYIGRGR